MWLINEGDTRARLCGFQPGGRAGRWQREAPPLLLTPRSGGFSERTCLFLSLCPGAVLLLPSPRNVISWDLGPTWEAGGEQLHQSSWIEISESVWTAVHWISLRHFKKKKNPFIEDDSAFYISESCILDIKNLCLSVRIYRECTKYRAGSLSTEEEERRILL